MSDRSVKESQLCSNERARKSKQCEPPILSNFREHNLTVYPARGRRILEGSWQSSQLTSRWYSHCAAHGNLPAFGSWRIYETFRVSKVMAARLVLESLFHYSFRGSKKLWASAYPLNRNQGPYFYSAWR